MIIKEISTQSHDANGERPYVLRNSEDYTPQEWTSILKYLKRNAKAHLLKFEIVSI